MNRPALAGRWQVPRSLGRGSTPPARGRTVFGTYAGQQDRRSPRVIVLSIPATFARGHMLTGAAGGAKSLAEPVTAIAGNGVVDHHVRTDQELGPTAIATFCLAPDRARAYVPAVSARRPPHAIWIPCRQHPRPPPMPPS